MRNIRYGLHLRFGVAAIKTLVGGDSGHSVQLFGLLRSNKSMIMMGYSEREFYLFCGRFCLYFHPLAFRLHYDETKLWKEWAFGPFSFMICSDVEEEES